MNKKNYITINCFFKFHQEIVPINKEILKEKEELFKRNLEKRVEQNIKHEKRKN
jgi:hypothetical protein